VVISCIAKSRIGRSGPIINEACHFEFPPPDMIPHLHTTSIDAFRFVRPKAAVRAASSLESDQINNRSPRNNSDWSTDLIRFVSSLGYKVDSMILFRQSNVRQARMCRMNAVVLSTYTTHVGLSILRPMMICVYALSTQSLLSRQSVLNSSERLTKDIIRSRNCFLTLMMAALDR
jgi:hypothetical protein